MNRFIYSTLFYLATPLLILRLLWRSVRSPAYLSRWSERFAFYPKVKEVVKTPLVFHAVSVGEVHAVVPLINQFLENQPALKILVTTSTPTGSSRVRALLGDKVSHVYLPYDYPGAVHRFLAHFSPSLLVIMETELWPNLIHGCSHSGVKIMLANARLSEKSRHNYSKIKSLAAKMLLQLDAVTAQSEQDAQRLQALGLPGHNVTVAGSMKFDMVINTEQVEQAAHDRSTTGERPVLIAASTRTSEGVAEDSIVLAAFKHLLVRHPDLLLVLVPRHPERFDEVYELALKEGLHVARRSREGSPESSHQVLLGDSMGEMHYYFGLSDIAFVGGSLVPTGCQNIIEPAALGLPVITGPSLYNFQAASGQLRAGKGMCVVADAKELARVVEELLGDEEKRRAMGNAARAVVEKNLGATSRNQTLISELLRTAR